MTFGQGQEMTLTLNTNLPSFTELVVCIYRKALVTKFDLAVKWVKVTPGSSFEQTMMDRSPRCYISSFVEIGPPVPEKMF